MTSPITAANIAYTLGDQWHEVGELDELAQRPDVRDTLLEFGLRKYCTSDADPLTLGRECAKRTLASSGVDPGTVDTLLVATSSFGRPDYFSAQRVATFMTDLGLTKAYPIGVTLSYCGNVHAALRMASLLIRSGDAERILLVCADRVSAGETRIVPPAISVSSDGAASCLVTGQESAGFAVLGTAQVCNPGLAPEEAEGRFMHYMQGVGRGLKQALVTLLASTETTVEQIDCVLPNNYNLWVLGNIGRVLGVDRKKVFADNIPRFAHANTADDFINLVDREEMQELSPGSIVLMLGTGPNMWGLTLLRKRHGSGRARSTTPEQEQT